jgi:very-short-patch-repair endonuclease
VCARSPGRRGIKPLKAIVAEHRGPAPETRSELERRFLALVREADLPEPSVSVVVAGFTVDFHWPSRGLVAEIDGYRFHRSRRSFEDDRARDAKLQLAGWRVLRVTERRLRDQPTVIAEEVRRLLALIASRAA